jgi:hypothetical protein
LRFVNPKKSKPQKNPATIWQDAGYISTNRANQVKNMIQFMNKLLNNQGEQKNEKKMKKPVTKMSGRPFIYAADFEQKT